MIIINIIILTPKTARKNRGTELRCWVTLSFHQAAPYENEDTTRQRRVGTWDAKRKPHAPINASESVRMSVRPSGDGSVVANSSYVSDGKKDAGDKS